MESKRSFFPRIDIIEKLTGAARFSAEQISPEAVVLPILSENTGKILSIELSEAVEVPGVIDVITAHHIPGENRLAPSSRPLLPKKEIDYPYQIFGLIIAESEGAAREAEKKVQLKLEPLEQGGESGDGEKSLGGPEHSIREGRIEQRETDIILERNFKVAPRLFSPIGGPVFSAEIDPDGGITIRGLNLYPYEIQHSIALVLGLPRNRVRIVQSIWNEYYPSDPISVAALASLTALAAWTTGYSVALSLPREYLQYLFGHYPQMEVAFKIGTERSGTFLFADCRLSLHCGNSSPQLEELTRELFASIFDPYLFPTRHLSVSSVSSNIPPPAVYSPYICGFLSAVRECLIDELAQRLHIEPLELREKNITPRYRSYFRHLAEKFAQIPPAEEGFYSGLALISSPSWLPPNLPVMTKIQVFPDGSLSLTLPLLDPLGDFVTQAVHLTSRELSLPPENIRVLPLDTARHLSTPSVHLPQLPLLVFLSLKNAISKLKKLFFKFLSQSWKIPQQKIQWKGDCFIGNNRRLTFSQLAQKAWDSGFSLAVQSPVRYLNESSPGLALAKSDVKIDLYSYQIEELRVNFLAALPPLEDPSLAENSLSCELYRELPLTLAPAPSTLSSPFYIPIHPLHLVKNLPQLSIQLYEIPLSDGESGDTEGSGEGEDLPKTSVFSHSFLGALTASIVNATSLFISNRIDQLPLTPEFLLSQISPSRQSSEPQG